MRLPPNTAIPFAAPLATLAACTTFATFASAAFTSAAIAAEPAAAAKPGQSVYGVRTYAANEVPLGAGSAVVVGPGLLATACNVLAGAQAITVRRDNVSYGATLEAPDVERNLCLLRVDNFSAPAAAVAAAIPGFGQKTHAVAVSDGRTVAMREAQVTGLQAGPDGRLDRIQLSLEADPAANGRDSGGGLFDEQGRLLGILSPPAAGDKRLRALPAAWIGEARARGAAAVATYQKSAPQAADRPSPAVPPAPAATVATVATGATVAASPAAATANPAAAASPRVGERWVYLLTDKLTNKQTPVTLRVDRIEGDRVIFNQGARLERKDGRLERIETPMAGEFDLASPPGGWVPPGVKAGARWKTSFKQASNGIRTEFTATAGSETTIRVPAGSYRALRVSFDGYIQRPFYGFNAESGSTTSLPYTAVAWYAPELGRIVRFEARFASKWESRHEVLELSEHRFD